jgi:putative phosphoribosyl transferase
MIFHNRFHAGQVLAQRLERYRDQPEVVILALPRGGVPVAFEVANSLHTPLDIFLVRKLGLPGHEELAIGAIASGGVQVLNRDVIDAAGVSEAAIARVAANELKELRRREREYRNGRPQLEIENRVAIVIDDGLATGSSMRAAAQAIRQHRPKRLVVAVPVAARSTCREFQAEVDEVLCAYTPEDFLAVGVWYDDFSQVSDSEVKSLLEEAAQRTTTGVQ